jgi:hypothetical protein
VLFVDGFLEEARMQIACKRYDCQKAVEVCYWSCKFRKNCKDWQDALLETPGSALIRERLEAAAKKTGRAFDPKLLIVPVRKKKAA